MRTPLEDLSKRDLPRPDDTLLYTCFVRCKYIGPTNHRGARWMVQYIPKDPDYRKSNRNYIRYINNHYHYTSSTHLLGSYYYHYLFDLDNFSYYYKNYPVFAINRKRGNTALPDYSLDEILWNKLTVDIEAAKAKG